MSDQSSPGRFPAEQAPPPLRLKSVVRTFRQGDAVLQVLRGIDLVLRSGEMVALVGPSGAGKSTMLQIAGLLERPTAGDVEIDGQVCGKLGDKARTLIRRNKLGFVYQHHHLLREFSATENVMVPQLIDKRSKRAARDRARALLERVGLGHRLTHRPSRLSGGEQQRVAVARALANAPTLLLADEPTGNLDSETGGHVFELLTGLVRETGLAALIATHNMDLAERMDRIVTMRDGVLYE
ncbi:MAG: ABC transporter ATP-binding protein [Alphaproteobacteria bacterium]